MLLSVFTGSSGSKTPQRSPAAPSSISLAHAITLAIRPKLPRTPHPPPQGGMWDAADGELPTPHWPGGECWSRLILSMYCDLPALVSQNTRGKVLPWKEGSLVHDVSESCIDIVGLFPFWTSEKGSSFLCLQLIGLSLAGAHFAFESFRIWEDWIEIWLN